MNNRICKVCGKEFIPAGNAQKYCEGCKGIAEKKQAKQYSKQWRKTHVKEKEEYQAQWRKDNPQYSKQWAKDHFEGVRRSCSTYRGLGFNPLNEPFGGCVSHHINHKDVIYIPEWMHRSIRHCLETRKGMAGINILAIRFLLNEEGWCKHESRI